MDKSPIAKQVILQGLWHSTKCTHQLTAGSFTIYFFLCRCVSCDIVITQFGHHVKFASKLRTLPKALFFIICHLISSFPSIIITMATKGFCQAIKVEMGRKKLLAEMAYMTIYLKDMVWNKSPTYSVNHISFHLLISTKVPSLQCLHLLTNALPCQWKGSVLLHWRMLMAVYGFWCIMLKLAEQRVSITTFSADRIYWWEIRWYKWPPRVSKCMSRPILPIIFNGTVYMTFGYFQKEVKYFTRYR